MKTRVDSVYTAPEILTGEIHVRLAESAVTPETLHELKRLCEANPGEAELTLCLVIQSGEMAFVRADDLRVACTRDFRQGVVELFGSKALWLRPRPVESNGRRPSSFPGRDRG